MATTTTPNLGLVKPDYNELADIDVINDNMDLIDTAVGNFGFSKILTGSAGPIAVAAGAYVDTQVTFSPAFTATPFIALTCSSTSTGADMGNLSWGITTSNASGFTVRVWNGGTTQRQPTIRWIALGN